MSISSLDLSKSLPRDIAFSPMNTLTSASEITEYATSHQYPLAALIHHTSSCPLRSELNMYPKIWVVQGGTVGKLGLITDTMAADPLKITPSPYRK